MQSEVLHIVLHIYLHQKRSPESIVVPSSNFTFIVGLVLSGDEKAFLPHDFTSCANAILMKDCDVALWQNQ